MKKHLILIVSVVILSLLSLSCKTKTGPTGPAGENVQVMNFQYGVYPSTSYTECENAEINEFDPDSVVDSTIYWAGMDSTYRERLLNKFVLSGYLPVNAKVVKAYLVLYCPEIGGAGSTPMALYRMTSNWSELSATWNDRILSTSWSEVNGGGDYIKTTAISAAVTVNTADKYYTWEIDAKTVQGWFDGTTANYGMILKSTTEAVETDAGFSSNSELDMPEYRPRLVVYYSL